MVTEKEHEDEAAAIGLSEQCTKPVCGQLSRLADEHTFIRHDRVPHKR